MRPKPKITPNWARLIDDLVAAGQDLQEIGAAMGYTQVTPKMLQFLRMGAEPMERRAAALMALWCKVMKLKPENAPRLVLQHGTKPMDLEPEVAPEPKRKLGPKPGWKKALQRDAKEPA